MKAGKGKMCLCGGGAGRFGRCLKSARNGALTKRGVCAVTSSNRFLVLNVRRNGLHGVRGEGGAIASMGTPRVRCGVVHYVAGLKGRL